MEDVLELYAEPYAPQRPQVCFDESPVQLISETRQPLPARPGQPARYDYEYRGFVANFAQKVMQGQLPLSVERIRQPGSRTVRPQ